MSIETNARPDGVGYFDEAYFERGWERGTAYVNYKESAASSQIFKAVAEALTSVFRPSSALEIGCATGAIVRSMNFLGVPTYGIDVSDWAVRNALHPNVRLASAAELPFPSGNFDLVYSSHSLEHLPDDVFMAAFKEIDRVCGPDAVQFHMLPIVGTYPYDYDEETAIRNLKSDPTHVLLKRMDWWLERWHELGWVAVPGKLFFPHDTDNVELSSGQFCLVRRGSDIGARVARAINDWNAKAFRAVYLERQQFLSKLPEPIRQLATGPELLPPPIGPANEQWDDFKVEFAVEHDLTDATVRGIVYHSAVGAISLRIALIAEGGRVLEKWLEIPPGYSSVAIGAAEFNALTGDPDLRGIRAVYFGGSIGDYTASANFAIEGPHVALRGIFT